jgi:hypothetical protein
MVSVAPLATFTNPLKVYTVSALSVRLAMMVPLSFAACTPLGLLGEGAMVSLQAAVAASNAAVTCRDAFSRRPIRMVSSTSLLDKGDRGRDRRGPALLLPPTNASVRHRQA